MMMITLKDHSEIGNRGTWLFLRMVLAMRVNGFLAHKFVKVGASRFGQMVQCTRDSGKTTKPMVKVD